MRSGGPLVGGPPDERTMVVTTPPRIPFWRDIRKLGVLIQVVSAVAAVGLVAFLIVTAFRGMVARGIPFTFAFLVNEAGFSISEGSLLTIDDGRLTWRPFAAQDAYLSAFVTGVFNTLKVAIVGIALATFLGVAVGIGRISTNWLLNRLAFVYVELVRNTPLLLQMFFWYFAVFLKLPGARDAGTWYGGLIVSSQGAFMPWPAAAGTVTPFVLVAVGGLVLAGAAYLAARRLGWAAWVAPAVLALAWAVGFAVVGLPFELSRPELGRFRVTGGMNLSPEFTAVLLGLVVYTGAFIAEVIRGAIQSVPKGQGEAAASLGLKPGQVMRLVILPQAVRIAIPPVGNLYLSLMKNTSLAVAVGYPDLFNVYKTIANQSGRSLEGIVIVMIVYLLLSFAISAAINAYNRRVTKAWDA